MSTANSDDPDDITAERLARRKVRALRGFYFHVMIYVTVMAMLLLINIMTGDAWGGNWWVQWPALPWGVALVIHGIIVMGGIDLFGRDWEDRKVEELVRRQRKPGDRA